jgi:HlyD family secretion protein
MMKKKALIGLLVVAVLAVILFGFVLKKSDKDKPKYRTETVTKGDIEALVTTSGTVNPIDLIDIGAQVSGKIVKLYADYNTMVKAGQIVAEIDPALSAAKVDQNQANYESAQARLEQAKVALDNTKKKYDRTLDLFQRNLVSFEEKETAESNYVAAKVGVQTATASVSQAKSQYDSSKVDLSYTIIRSPIDGIVISRVVNLGQTVASSFNAPVLFKVASDLSKMRVTCAVDEADIGKLKEGQKVRFTVDAFQGETFNGEVQQVRNSATTVQNVVTYETIVTAENPQGKLKPGMTATVQIITGQAKGVIKVPNSGMRFTPNLPAAELQKIFEEMRAQRQGQPGQPGQAAQPGQTGQTAQPGQRTEGQAAQDGQRGGDAQGGQRQGGGQRMNLADMTPEQMQAFMQRMSQGRRGGGQVWVLDEATGKIKPYQVRTGVTDNTYSEMLRGELKEGMKVILGELGAANAATQQQGQNRGGPGGMMMFR